MQLSIDDGKPQVVNMQAGSNDHADDSDSLWNHWVADNINAQTSSFSNVDAGSHVIKLWMIDPGVVFERLLITTRAIPSSYLGPPKVCGYTDYLMVKR